MLNEIETILHDIWTQVLHLQSIRQNENFLALSGSSLQGAEIVSQVNETFQIDLPLGAIFEAPTIAILAQLVEDAVQQGTQASLPPVHPAPNAVLLPLSPAQRSTWYLMNQAPHLPLYHMCVTIRIPGPVDQAAMERALNAILRRHGALRTTFDVVDGRNVQVVHPELSITLQLRDRQGMDESQLKLLVPEQASRPFDLRQGPLIRATLEHGYSEESLLYLTVHHLIFDEISLQKIFLPELKAIYAAFSRGEPSPYPPSAAFQYADYTLWQQEIFTEEKLAPVIAFWKERLRDLPSLVLSNIPAPKKPTYHGAVEEFFIPSELTLALYRLSQKRGVTVFMTLLALFKTLLFYWSSQPDFAVFIPASGRLRAELQTIMGLLATAVLVRDTLSGQMQFTALLSAVRKTVLEAYEHQELSLRRLLLLLQAVNPQHEGNILFAFNGCAAVADIGWQVSSDLDLKTAKLDLYLKLVERSEGIQGIFEYSLDRFDQATISQMAKQFCALIYASVRRSDATLDQLWAECSGLGRQPEQT